MNRFICILFLFCSLVQADELPTYLPALKGLVLDSITERSEFHLSPGQLQRCEREVVSGDWVSFKCAVQGSTCSVVSTNGKAQSFEFERVFVNFRYLPDSRQYFNEYIFIGNWVDTSEAIKLSSRVRLIVSHPRKTNELIQGTIFLDDFGLSRGVAASPVK